MGRIAACNAALTFELREETGGLTVRVSRNTRFSRKNTALVS
jgi:hypothetical protein